MAESYRSQSRSIEREQSIEHEKEVEDEDEDEDDDEDEEEDGEYDNDSLEDTAKSEKEKESDEEMNVLKQPLEPMSISSSSSSSAFFEPAVASYFDTSTLVQDFNYMLSVLLDKFGPFYPIAIVAMLMLAMVSITQLISKTHMLIHPNTLPPPSTLLYHLKTQSIRARYDYHHRHYHYRYHNHHYHHHYHYHHYHDYHYHYHYCYHY